jgi:hypothetical protein
MSSKNTSHDTPRVVTNKSGRRYASTVEVLYSRQARKEIGRYVKLSKANKTNVKSGTAQLENR